jgi:beta-lactamase regulating signal transducer with metallopeptidase domain
MSAPAALEVWLSLTLQVALLAAATVWIERRSAQDESGDRIWAAFHLAVLALTAVAWIGPHLRLVDARALVGSASVERILALEERTAAAVLSLWACGAVVGAASLSLGVWQSARVVRAARPVAEEIRRKLLVGVVGELGDASDIDVRVTTLPVSPFCWQLSRPVIVLPENLLPARSEIVRSIVAHESSHLRAGHPLQLFLQRLVEIIYWHHPAAWMTSRRAAAQREFFADSFAVRSRDDAACYLKGLLFLAQRFATSVGLPAGLAFGGGPTQIEQRAQRLAERDWTRRRPARCNFPWIRMASAAALCAAAWLPVNIVASSRSEWSPWPRWSASALHELGIHVRDYEIDAHRLLPHHHENSRSIG